MNQPLGRFCTHHGGDVSPSDAWLCDTCARTGINPCSCGSPARYFGEALMTSVKCESCEQFVMQIAWQPDIRILLNQGLRGVLGDEQCV
jgi:hypothetical protein